MTKQQTIRRRARQRRGAAVMEFAVCLPVLVLIVFASLEAASMIFTQQALQTAATKLCGTQSIPGRRRLLLWREVTRS